MTIDLMIWYFSFHCRWCNFDLLYKCIKGFPFRPTRRTISIDGEGVKLINIFDVMLKIENFLFST